VIPLFFRGPRQNKCLRENKMGRVVAELFFAQDCEPACRLPAALKFLAYPILKIFNAGSRNNLIVGNHRCSSNLYLTLQANVTCRRQRCAREAPKRNRTAAARKFHISPPRGIHMKDSTKDKIEGGATN
jgi:hypothetical protein